MFQSPSIAQPMICRQYDENAHNRMGANVCLKDINDKHSPTKGINVIITDKITIKAKEIAQCRELVSILYILLFINITNSYFIG